MNRAKCPGVGHSARLAGQRTARPWARGLARPLKRGEGERRTAVFLKDRIRSMGDGLWQLAETSARFVVLAFAAAVRIIADGNATGQRERRSRRVGATLPKRRPTTPDP